MGSWIFEFYGKNWWIFKSVTRDESTRMFRYASQTNFCLEDLNSEIRAIILASLLVFQQNMYSVSPLIYEDSKQQNVKPDFSHLYFSCSYFIHQIDCKSSVMRVTFFLSKTQFIQRVLQYRLISYIKLHPLGLTAASIKN